MFKRTRRSFLEVSGLAFLSSISPPKWARAAITLAEDTASALRDVIERTLGPRAAQIQLRYSPQAGMEKFEISGQPGQILIDGSSPSSVLMGVNWYLKYVAGVSTSWNGDSLDHLPATLPAPPSPISQSANVQHRFALNDTNDGYTGPYWTWEQWEHLIDALALHGINEVLVYMGAEAVYQQTFRKFGYSDEELRRWFPTPAHQPWWLLENISGWVGPTVPQHLIDSRLQLAAKITSRLRELGMTPVLPGYYGMVPDGFVEKNPGARIVPQGTWLGIKRPDWLDATSDFFPAVAQEFYGAQQKLLGLSTMFKMDPLHEGGLAGNVNLTSAASCIEEQLQKAHPGAIWAILGWQHNPKREVLAGIKDKSHVLILDGQSDRFAYQDREEQWSQTPYAFGTIWNFGGHTTLGANLGVWNERYFDQLTKSGSKLNGIAIMPEASCNNPAAFAFFSELAWRRDRPDLSRWFAQWAAYRYGGSDESAVRAWDIVRETAYSEPSGKWSESHDNLFSAQPSLTAKSACSFSPKEPRYDLGIFQSAIGNLLQVRPSLRTSSAYRYDLVDIARQTIANQSRILLPQINAAYTEQDIPKFRQLTRQWLDRITQLNRVVGTEPSFLFGRWAAAAKAAGNNSAEQAQLEFDARSLLLEWGPESSRDSGVHDYANREWNGLLEFYRDRWSLYFAALEASLLSYEPPKDIDWFTVDQSWAKHTNSYAVAPVGDAYEIVSQIIRTSL
jgi:hypothetical protein